MFMPKITQYTYDTLLDVSQKYIGLINISFDMWQNIT
jgi:hypothetical protein